MKKSAKKKKAKKQRASAVSGNGTKLPNKIACSICHTKKGVRPDVLQKRLKDYGTLENLLEKYECQKCRQRPESKAPTAPKAKQAENEGRDHVHPVTGKNVYFWQMPGWSLKTKTRPYHPADRSEDYFAAYGNTCAAPNIYLDNNRFCDSCPFYNTCTCSLKRSRADGGVITTPEGGTKKMSYYMRKKLGLLKFTHKK